MFSSEDNRIEFAVLCDLLEKAAARTGNESFGLMVGLRGGLRSIGPISRPIKQSTTAGKMISNLISRRAMRDRGSVFELAQCGPQATLRYIITDPCVARSEQMVDKSVANASRILQAVLGDQWRPISVHLSRRLPQDPGRYSTAFSAPVGYDAPTSCISFDKAWLSLPINGLIDALPVKDEYFAPNLSDDVVRLSLTRLFDGLDASSEQIARMLGIARRSLHRRLRATKTSFQILVDQGKYGAASRMLLGTSLSTTDTALALGYRDPAEFAHSFQEWSGQPPSEYRRTQERPASPFTPL